MTARTYASDTAKQPSLLSSNSTNSISVSNADHRDVPPVPRSTATITGGGINGEGDSSTPSSSFPAESSFISGSRGNNGSNDANKTIIKKKMSAKGGKRVSWDRIHTREFVLVVGDHPMCQDGLPVSLGWQYDDHSFSTKNMNPIPVNNADNPKEDGTKSSSSIRQEQKQQQQQQIQLSERRQSYVFPRRLSYEERRERLVSVSNLTLDQIKNDEIDLVVRTLKESWEVEDHIGDRGQTDYDIVMEPVELDNGFCPLDDENLMELDDMDIVPGIDIDYNYHDGQDLGDITNFEWTDEEARKTTNPAQASRN
mmetsp:Transcript_20934/g.44436  ORF Transcript_20934/g.44436 Transcript_20934/m.44436 type:complete len:311 (-) Transcript_20934:45-977(-)|eukprot:CAMPEP_0168167508 /NCGR_PEP_ID=MMETSP0139_2-20121125/2582_1 /TAXON_ID=44445 /ORGANISM="Pseudo-nitzschia australis, Strain 10249 10 AB" /LENGTH=310 /DNA_ID=CAMNT_0008084745 /DNA_START=178 /DNA_END=1110 /DNA_ORIENTATION=+